MQYILYTTINTEMHCCKIIKIIAINNILKVINNRHE